MSFINSYLSILLFLGVLTVMSAANPSSPQDYNFEFPALNMDEDLEGAVEDLETVEGRDADGKSCGGSCGSSYHTPDIGLPLHHLSSLAGSTAGLTSIFGDTKLLAFVVPMLILQIITLSFIAYLIKSEKRSYGGDDYDTYVAYAPAHGGSYGGGGSGYRSFDERQGNWLTDGLAKAVDVLSKNAKESF